jgi:hypothetical protein
MSEIDRIFSRLGPKKSTPNDKREVLNIPRKGSALGSRTVQVVHVRSGQASAGKEAPRRSGAGARSATWEDGFPARAAALPPQADAPAASEQPDPVTHVMPMWAPTQVEAAPAPADAATSEQKPATLRGPRAKRVADPFDADDDGANCLRCGYMIDPGRERRGLMTCAACG